MIKKMLFIVSLVFAFLSAPALLADVTQVNYGVSDSANYQSMQDIKACEACHVAPEQKQRQNSTEYKVKTSHVIGGGSSNAALLASNVKQPGHYFEVGWRK